MAVSSRSVIPRLRRPKGGLRRQGPGTSAAVTTRPTPPHPGCGTKPCPGTSVHAPGAGCGASPHPQVCRVPCAAQPRAGPTLCPEGPAGPD